MQRLAGHHGAGGQYAFHLENGLDRSDCEARR